MKRFISSSLAALALTGFSANHASADCQYQVTSDWGGGFLGQVTYTNDTDTPLDNWSFDMTFANSMVNSAWGDANWQGANPTTISAPSWNPVLQPGQTQNMYFVAQSLNNSGGETPSIEGQPCSNSTSNIIFSEDFESTPVNESPKDWDHFVGWVYNWTNNNLDNNAFALTDDTIARSGQQALRVKAGQQPAQISKRLPENITSVFTRMWIYSDHKLGNTPGDNHEHITGIRRGNDANHEIRIGQSKGHLGFNHVPSDNVSPPHEKWFSGPSTPINEWFCVEIGYTVKQPMDSVSMWVNGELVHSALSGSDWNNGPINNNFIEEILEKDSHVFFGWHSFSSNDINMWIDDIVVATGRIGCN